jgi:dihydrofolate reductase
MVNEFAIIVACTSQGGIGCNNSIPWYIPADLKHFRDVTTKTPLGKVNVVIMGKNTWVSLPKQHKPLKGRLNVVVSTTLTDEHDGVMIATSFKQAIEHVAMNSKVHNVFVIGGARLYNEALIHPLFKTAYVTQIQMNGVTDVKCDTFIDLSILESNFSCQRQESLQTYNDLGYRFCEFVRLAQS